MRVTRRKGGGGGVGVHACEILCAAVGAGGFTAVVVFEGDQ